MFTQSRQWITIGHFIDILSNTGECFKDIHSTCLWTPLSSLAHRPWLCLCRGRRAWCWAGSSGWRWGTGPGWSVWPARPPSRSARPAPPRGWRSRCPRPGCPGSRGPACPLWRGRPRAVPWTPGGRGSRGAPSHPAETRPPGVVKDIRGHPEWPQAHPTVIRDRGWGGGLMAAVNPGMESMFYW